MKLITPRFRKKKRGFNLLIMIAKKGMLLFAVVLLCNSTLKSQYVHMDPADSLNFRTLWDSLCQGCINQFGYIYIPPQNGAPAYHGWGPSGWTNGKLYSINTDDISSYNIINGFLPSVIGNFSELWQLKFVNQPGLTGPIPPELGQLPKLKWLYFDSTSISGNIPCELFDIPTLEWLRINSPHINGILPPCLCNASKLHGLYVQNTRLTGNFPDCIGSMDSLTTIYFENNKTFGGVLTDTLFKGSSITSMYLLNNNFHGVVPSVIQLHPTLRYLWLKGEKFTGTLPVNMSGVPLNINIPHCEFTDLLTPLQYPVSPGIIEYFYVINNKLTFGTFENFYFAYGNDIPWSVIFELVPQDSVWSPLDTTVLPGSSITFESYVSGQYNAYMWYKDTAYLGWNTTGLWTIHNASAADSGTYYCRIYNQYITPDRGLMLYRHHIRLHVDTTVSAQNGSAYQEPQIFPVPFSRELNINLNKLAGNFTTVTLYNSAGIPVFACETRKYYRIIDTEKLPTGLYFLKLQQGDKVFTYKVVKET